LRGQEYAVLRLHPRAKEKAPHASGISIELAVGEAHLTVALDPAQRDAVTMRVDTRLEQLEKIAVRGNDRVPLRLLLETRKHPFLEAGEMHLEEVLAPVELLGVPRNARALRGVHALVDRPGVVAAEDVAVLPDEGQEQLDQSHE